jgi:hypothetical protein
MKCDNCPVSKCDGPATHTTKYAHMHAGLHHHSFLSSACRAVLLVTRRASWKCGSTIEAGAAA